MNRILNVNLGGYAITIDDDAYEYLNAYLDSIRRRFSESDGRDEILHDIEARMGELITGTMVGRSIVMLPDVEAAVNIMGKPEAFGADPIDNRRNMGNANNNRDSRAVRPGKRLFRDEDDASVGGVCSGLAAYFGMADPLWMRLIFVLLTFLSAGFWIPAYILLWILVPPAKSAADRLAMRGEPVNVDNIAKEIETGFDRISQKVNDIGSGAKKKSTENGRSFGNALAGGVSVLGRIFGFVIQFFLKFGVFILVLIAAASAIGLLVSWIAGIWAVFAAAPYMSFVSPLSSGATYAGVTNMFFLAGIPFLALLLFFSRLLFKTRTSRWLNLGLVALWVVNLISFVVIGGKTVQNYRYKGSFSKNIDAINMSSDTLRLEFTGGYRENYHDEDGEIHLGGEALHLKNGDLSVLAPLDIRVKKASGRTFGISQTTKSQGYNSEDAANNAASIEYEVELRGNTLYFPQNLMVKKGNKYRFQRIVLYVDVPEGKFLSFGEGVNHRVQDVDYDGGNRKNQIYRNPNKIYRMESGGLLCVDCPRWGDKDFEDDEHFEDFILEGNFETEITKGDRFSISIEGDAAKKSNLRSIESGETLTLTSDRKDISGLKVHITTRVFTSLVLEDKGNVHIRGFNEGRSSITQRGNSAVKATYDSDNLDVVLSENSKLVLVGRGDQFNASLSGNSVLESGAFKVENLRVSASDSSKGVFNSKQSAHVKKDGTSDVRVEGGADMENQ